MMVAVACAAVGANWQAVPAALAVPPAVAQSAALIVLVVPVVAPIGSVQVPVVLFRVAPAGHVAGIGVNAQTPFPATPPAVTQ